jgi:hypothetical protein
VLPLRGAVYQRPQRSTGAHALFKEACVEYLTPTLAFITVLMVFLASRIGVFKMQGSGGGRIRIYGRWIPFHRAEIGAIFAELLSAELRAVNLVVDKDRQAKKLKLQGRSRGEVNRAKPTKADRQAADGAWEQAALRWLRQHPERARELRVPLN